MGASQRAKGHSFERRVAKWLRDHGIGNFWRETDETQQGNVGDVRDKASRFPLVIQCKHQKAPSPWKAMKEAEEAVRPGELAVAAVRRHGGEDLVIMRPRDFMVLLRAIEAQDAYDSELVAIFDDLLRSGTVGW